MCRKEENFVKKVAVVMGSASDAPLAKDALKTLKQFGVPYTARVLSAHRSPDEAAAFAKGATCGIIATVP